MVRLLDSTPLHYFPSQLHSFDVPCYLPPTTHLNPLLDNCTRVSQYSQYIAFLRCRWLYTFLLRTMANKFGNSSILLLASCSPLCSLATFNSARRFIFHYCGPTQDINRPTYQPNNQPTDLPCHCHHNPAVHVHGSKLNFWKLQPTTEARAGTKTRKDASHHHATTMVSPTTSVSATLPPNVSTNISRGREAG